MQRILFLASGRGSNFAALARAIQDGIIPQAVAVGLVTDNPSAPAIETASQHKIPVTIVDKNRFRGPSGKWDRKAYDRSLFETVEQHQPDWICLAGYMLLVDSFFAERWAGKILNIHPSLLPAFPGLEAQRRALEAGLSETGCTVHLVTAELDAGPILLQSRVPILPGDNEISLGQRLLPVEHATYIEVLKRICTRGFRIEGDRIEWN